MDGDGVPGIISGTLTVAGGHPALGPAGTTRVPSPFGSRTVELNTYAGIGADTFEIPHARAHLRLHLCITFLRWSRY